MYGIPRATQDVDLVADLLGKPVEPLVARLSPEFYIDADRIKDALARRASFNVVHLPTMYKADIFAFVREPWSAPPHDAVPMTSDACGAHGGRGRP